MNRKIIFSGIFMVLFFVCLSPGGALAQTLYFVNTTSETVIVGACENSLPGCSLRGAIGAANSNPGEDGIEISIPASDPGCVGGVCTINMMSVNLPTITTSMSITGPGADKLIVRNSPNVTDRVFGNTTGLTVTISGITITGGGNPSGGGGIDNDGTGTVNLINCTVRNNRSNAGGGIYNEGHLNVINSTVSNNISNIGVSYGGGIVSIGTMNIVNSTISHNTSASAGGGIYTSGDGQVLNITNSTISHNISQGDGGGIRNFHPFGTGNTVNVKGSIIAMNTDGGVGPDVRGNFVSAGFNLIGKTDGSTGFTAPTDQTGTIAVPLDPMLDLGLQYNGGPTPTHALLIGSPAIDKGTSNGLTGNLTTDQRGTGFPRTIDDPGVPNAVGGDGTDIGAFELQTVSRPAPFDFDGDGKTDIGIFRPNAAGEWWINRSLTGQTFALQFGASSDRIMPADYTGDGKADIAFFRPNSGQWFVLRSEDFSFFAFPFGTNGDIPAPADYDADGKADPAIFRPSSATWFVSRSGGGGTLIVQFGINGDQPIVADYDNDGKADIGIFRNNAGVGEWWINRSTAGLLAMQFGAGTDKPVQGDYTGDGKADVAIWRPSTGEWLIVRSEDFSFFGFRFGTVGDVVAPGDYDGDGKFDATVFRPSSATWFIARSTAGTQIVQYGLSGDRPIANAFVP